MTASLSRPSQQSTKNFTTPTKIKQRRSSLDNFNMNSPNSSPMRVKVSFHNKVTQRSRSPQSYQSKKWIRELSETLDGLYWDPNAIYVTAQKRWITEIGETLNGSYWNINKESFKKVKTMRCANSSAGNHIWIGDCHMKVEPNHF